MTSKPTPTFPHPPALGLSPAAGGRSPIIALVGTNPMAPSFRLRLAPLVQYLERLGLDARVRALRGPEWWRVWRLARAWRESDLLVFSKIKLLAGERAFVAGLCPTWVLDVDDAIMFRKPPRHGDSPDKAWWRRHRFRQMVKRCGLVVAASRSLASTIEGDGTRVETLPTSVSLASHPQAALAGDGPLKLAWIGLGANLRYLADLAPVFRELVKDGLAFELHVISDRMPHMSAVPCRLVRWSEETEGAALAACDVGLAPLTDDAWTRGKGGYRSIQYAAAGLPSVASPVGANCEVVSAGETGLFATTPHQWRAALKTLGSDGNLRRRLGAAARQRARVYDRAVIVPRYADLILKLLQDESGSRS